ncbi:TPA: StfH/YfcO family fimbrial adhesin [Escherichia coli]
MKLLRNFMGLLTLMVLSLTAQAEPFQMYTPMGVPSFLAKIVFSLEVVTPAGMYTGTYQSHNPYMLQVGNLDLISWNGPSSIPAPTIYLDHSDEKDISFCPGLAGIPSTNGRGWDCYAADLKVTVTGEVQGCPWLVSSQITTTDQGAVGATYIGPKVHNSACPSIPLTTYDVSWDENTVKHKKTLNLQSADAIGGIIETTLSTYLMESQKLCDGSDFQNPRGANCRFVSQMITFTASGCDDAKVTVTPVPHPITDRQLHDIVVRVDASALQPIDSTCRFQYVLNMF